MAPGSPYVPIPRKVTIFLAGSLLFNLACVGAAGHVIRGRGGLRYLQTIITKDPAKGDLSILDMNIAKHLVYGRPQTRPIVMLGDSLTEQIDWSELFGNRYIILNRGIGGDTSGGILRRLDSIAKLQPAAVFLLAGTNDPQLLGLTPEDSAKNTAEIVRRLQSTVPGVKVYLESLLPSRSPKYVEWSRRTNELLRRVPGAEYINLRERFEESPGGLLKESFTWDGLHLTAAGYREWRDALKPIVENLHSNSCKQ